jgi:hypothetical protein
MLEDIGPKTGTATWREMEPKEIKLLGCLLDCSTASPSLYFRIKMINREKY